MSSQLNLENLSNREIKELWEKTRNEQRKLVGLREAQSRANADLGVDDEAPFWIDGFGNRIEGRRPAPKSGGYYIDSAGYARDCQDLTQQLDNSHRFRGLTMPRRFIAHICFLSLVLSAAVPIQAQQVKTDSDSAISQTLQAIEQAWLNAEKNHDAATFEKLVADDWIAISPDGKSQTKDERAAEIKTAHVVSATLGGMRVRVFGDTAVVTGTDDEITMTDGKKSSDHYVWTDVFVKRNGEWLAVASQTAQIK